MNDIPGVVIFGPLILFAVLLAACGGALAYSHKAAVLRTEAIERGYGLYCPTTGEFAWAGECEEGE